MVVAYYRAFIINFISLKCAILSTLKVTQYSWPINTHKKTMRAGVVSAAVFNTISKAIP